MFEFFLKNLPVRLEGESVSRKELCRCCGGKEGVLISRIDYWDIKETDIIKCSGCGTAQLDPMLTDDETSKGCLAYYIEETLRTSHKAQEKNNLRNYRRGIHFAYGLKKKSYSPKSILELGPGSGYFLEGIRFVFPEVKISVLDINQELLDFNKAQHGFDTHLATPEHFIPGLENKFDLIIARDIIEHVTGIDAVFSNVRKYLKKGGLFHFITPNGHEDVWRFYIRYKEKKERSELLINHVNYFDGKGLVDHLSRENFKEVSYYTYKLKTTIRGRGRKVKQKLMAPVSQKRSADFYVNEKIGEIRSVDSDKKEILNKWYLKPNRKTFAKIICWYKHSEWIKVNPRINVGHEIFGIFEKID